ncbi:MAG: hypothetical protein ACRCZ2_06715 [Fusobacteriaceae bacterium]
MKIDELERMSDMQKKNGSYNYLLTICMALTLLSVGTIIWQNTRVLESISTKLNDMSINEKLLLNQLQTLENKVDLLFLEKYDIKKKVKTNG